MKTRQYLTICLAILTMAATSAYGKPLSPEQALDRALASSESRRAPSNHASAYRMIFNSSDAVYLFGNDGGYIVVPGDDMAPAVLGYSDAGKLSQGEIPPAMKWWLSTYTAQIESAVKNGYRPAAARAERSPIAPLVDTEWNQGYPFNSRCPEIDGKTAMTGCVATAMAQVMKYHRWPAVGTGSNSYTSGDTDISLDFSDTPFDWSAMTDTYADNGGDIIANTAVSDLMYACGVAVDMQYGSSSSGAVPFNIASALIEYFNYDPSVHYVPRDYYDMTSWEDYIYSQLGDYGPVIYSGRNDAGGHTFVCDGYSSDGYFHINWGWGGTSNGYFLLTALDPQQQGIGGTVSGYNSDQSAIACISKPSGNTSRYVNLLMEGTLGISEPAATLGETITITGETYNFSTGKLSGIFGIKMTDSDGKTYYTGNSSIDALKPLSGIGAYYVTLPDSLSEGTYKVTPAFLTSANKWVDIPVKISGPQYITMTVSGKDVAFEKGVTPAITADNLALLSEIYGSQSIHVSASLVNKGSSEYYGEIAPALFDSKGEIVAIGDEFTADVEGGETEPMDYVGKFSTFPTGSEPTAGNYTLYIIQTSDNKTISTGIAASYHATAENTSISVSNLKVADASYVDPDNLTITATVKCTEGYFGGSLTIAIFPAATSGSVSSIASFDSDPLFLAEGESAALNAKGRLDNVIPGGRYMAAIFETSRQMSPTAEFTIGGLTAIESVGENETGVYPAITDGTLYIKGDNIAQARVYTSGGAIRLTEKADYGEIDISPLPSGVYFIELIPADPQQKHTINRVIRR